MKVILWRLFLLSSISQIFYTTKVISGLNQFTDIDSFGKWTIEQKFTPEKNKIECRASVKGYGTWFSERIRLDGNDQLLIPEDALYNKKTDIFDYLAEVRKALLNCRSSLLYIRK